jgi:acetyl-CoA carboxylase biotin carboxyl carrier protein
MNLDTIKQVLELIREHDLAEFEIEQEGVRLKVRRDGGALAHHPAASHVSPAGAAPLGGGAAPPAAAAADPAAHASEEIELAVMKSPIVGTFYRSPEPGASAFVEVGSIVKKGQVLCIIEAMKLMNEIESEYEGEVVSIYVENGHAVQYGERLFAIRAK